MNVVIKLCIGKGSIKVEVTVASEVGCPSVYCEYVLLPLVNKEGDLAGTLSKDKRKKKGESGRCQQPPEKQDVN